MRCLNAVGMGLLGIVLVSCSRDPSDLSQRGLDLLQEGNASAAYRRFSLALQNTEEEAAAGALWNGLGVSAALMGREEEAEEAFRTAWATNPEGWAAYVNAGILFRGQGRGPEADAAFAKGLQVAPSPSWILEFRAAEALRNGNMDRAMEWLQEAVRRNPTARSLSSLAVVSVNVLSVEERRALLLEAVALDPQTPAAQLNLAALLDQHRFEPEQARNHYEAFIRLSPESPLVPQVQQRLHVLEARELSGEVAQPDPVRGEVEAFLEQAASAESERQALVLCLRAHAVAARANRLDLRERSLRAATALVPSSPRGFVGLGRCFAEQGRHQEAYEAFAEGVQLAPEWGPAWQGLVESCLQLGTVEEGVRVLEQVEQSAQEQPDVLLSVGEFYRRLPDGQRRAAKVFSRIQSAFPESDAAKELSNRPRP